ncbi:hypothetical protein CEXT_377521 [Caerostris extrusa]|uniref:Maturase K n=1 Tax=Caerostris extrusa TaxID=172846 RepID=A0AAV4WLL7_CAEEX|nr:hypothetical protein CEXT_377521 [Caerostris extrusa]
MGNSGLREVQSFLRINARLLQTVSVQVIRHVGFFERLMDYHPLHFFYTTIIDPKLSTRKVRSSDDDYVYSGLIQEGSPRS